MRLQEPEQWQSSETPGTTGLEYGPYRAETGQNALGQKIFPQESRVSVLNVLIIVFSAIGFVAAFLCFYASALLLIKAGPDKFGEELRMLSLFVQNVGILGLVCSIVALLLFVTIFVLSVIAAVRRAARFRQSRFR